MIVDFEPRIYQESILNTVVRHNSLVILPTGLGKTAIALMLSAKRIRDYPDSKILFLSPTKPLASQHFDFFKKHIDMDEKFFGIFTGEVSPKERKSLWSGLKFIFSTPQSIENDIISGKINLKEISLIIFDEAHKATGNYSYVFIAEQYSKHCNYPRILGLTASPGHTKEEIQDVMKNLFIEKIEFRDEKSPDVKPYVKETVVFFEEIKLEKPFMEISEFLKNAVKKRIDILKKSGFNVYKKSEMLMAQSDILKRISSGEKEPELFEAVSLLAQVIKIDHGLELFECQSVKASFNYFKKILDDAGNSKSKAVKNISSDTDVLMAFKRIALLKDAEIEHPKLSKTTDILDENFEDLSFKAIIFTQFRDTAKMVFDKLESINPGSARMFFGQMKKNGEGMSQKKQKETLDDFRQGKFNILISTSVGEEGIDIPFVDLVIFYEPVPSAIRYIQRKGRTGRQGKGKAVIFVVKGTREEAYKWSTHNKKKKMAGVLEGISTDEMAIEKNKKILEFSKKSDDVKKIKIFVDHREKNSAIVKHLLNKSSEISVEALDSADYIVSSDCGIEYKTMKDFIDSIIDRRLITQMRNISSRYSKPVLIIEGDEDLYSQRNIHQNAVRGMVASIITGFRVPIFQTKNPLDTAEMIYALARREQEDKETDFVLEKGGFSTSNDDEQEIIIASIPDVGPVLAKKLLHKFKTIKKIVNSSAEELKQVEGIGDKKAKRIIDIFSKEYEF